MPDHARSVLTFSTAVIARINDQRMMKTLIIVFASLMLTVRSFASAWSITEQDKAFRGEVRSAVLADDPRRVASLIFLPMSVRVDGKKITVSNEAEFVAHYREIVTPKIKKAVQQQSVEQLWKNWQGVMVGNGEIWFSAIKPEGMDHFVYRIIGINP